MMNFSKLTSPGQVTVFETFLWQGESQYGI